MTAFAQDLDQAAGCVKESDAAVAAYEQDLAEARIKANAIANTARDKAKADAEAEQRKAEAALEVRLTEAERRIASIKDAAMSDVGVIGRGNGGGDRRGDDRREGRQADGVLGRRRCPIGARDNGLHRLGRSRPRPSSWPFSPT